MPYSNDQLFQKQRKSLFFDGNCLIQLKKSSTYDSVLNELKQLNTLSLKEHIDFTNNYEDVYDLKNDALLNELLVEFLFDQNIPEQINKISGREYVLGDLVLRKSKQKKSYMPWHRDTYLDKNKELVGRIPPLLKIIFYPQLEKNASHELSLINGSNRMIINNYYLDKFQRFFTKNKKIFQCNDSCILFDSSIIHSAIASSPTSKGSFRLIYNFCDKSQLETFKKVKNINNTFNEKKLLY